MAAVAAVKPCAAHDALESERHADAVHARITRTSNVINVSDSFVVHDRRTLQCRIFLTPGPHALFGDLPLSSVLHADCVGGIRFPWAFVALGVGPLVGEDGDAPERPLAIG